MTLPSSEERADLVRRLRDPSTNYGLREDAADLIDALDAALTAAELVCSSLYAKWEADAEAEKVWSGAFGWPHHFLEGPHPVLDAQRAANSVLDEAVAAHRARLSDGADDE